MLEFLTFLFHGIIGLPGVIWGILMGLWAAVPIILYFLMQGVLYGVLTLTRTVGMGVLILFAIVGAILYFVYWTADYFMFLDQLQHHELIFLSLWNLFVVSLPVYFFLYRTPGGKGLNLMDGLAIGAFTGIGYYLVFHLHYVLVPQSLLAWPPGSYVTQMNALIPDTFYFYLGLPATGALIGAAMVLSQKMKSGYKLWFLPMVVVGVLVFAEWMVFKALANPHLVGDQTTLWWHLAEKFNYVDFAGRLSGTLFLLVLAAVFVAGEKVLSRFMAKNDWMRLEGEPARPGFLNEVSLACSALPHGLAAVLEVWGFFGARRRVAMMEFMAENTDQGNDPDYLYYKELATDIAADRLFRARAALKGDPVSVTDAEGEGRWKTFVKGLLLAMVGAYVYLTLISHFGLLISQALGRRLGNDGDPMGFVYATILVTGLSFALIFYKDRLLKLIPVERGLNALGRLLKSRKSKSGAEKPSEV